MFVDVSHTKRSTRIIIWVITIVMAGGFIGTYFLVILNNNDQLKQQELAQDTLNSAKDKPVDSTAYTTDKPVTSLQKVDLVVGSGATVKPLDTVHVHYKGTLATTGQKFDSSYDRGEPVTLSLGGVIQGWQEGVPGMKVGGKRRLVVPAALAYGEYGSNGIPPNSDLVFEIEVLAILPKVDPAE